MSHYEERLERDLNGINQKIRELGDRVEKSIRDSVTALLTGDHALSYNTIIGDNPVNRGNEEVAQKCYAFIARHLPSAGHLRRISSILRVCVDLERIGDMAVSICRQAVQLSSPLDKTMTRNVEVLAEEVRHMLHQAITAYHEDNVELARSTAALASQKNRSFSIAFDDLANEENKEKYSVKDLLGLLSIFYSLERVGDQSKNLCEETVFVVTGQTKQRKPVNILFLEEANDYLSLMAEAIGRKICANCGRYTSAGTRPAHELDADLVKFMGKSGVDFLSNKPKSLDTLPRLDEFTVLISLQGPVTSYIPHIPFQSVALEWEVGPLLADIPGDRKEQQFETSYRELSHRISTLLELLRGREGF